MATTPTPKRTPTTPDPRRRARLLTFPGPGCYGPMALNAREVAALACVLKLARAEPVAAGWLPPLFPPPEPARARGSARAELAAFRAKLARLGVGVVDEPGPTGPTKG